MTPLRAFILGCMAGAWGTIYTYIGLRHRLEATLHRKAGGEWQEK